MQKIQGFSTLLKWWTFFKGKWRGWEERVSQGSFRSVGFTIFLQILVLDSLDAPSSNSSKRLRFLGNLFFKNNLKPCMSFGHCWVGFPLLFPTFLGWPTGRLLALPRWDVPSGSRPGILMIQPRQSCTHASIEDAHEGHHHTSVNSLRLDKGGKGSKKTKAFLENLVYHCFFVGNCWTVAGFGGVKLMEINRN